MANNSTTITIEAKDNASRVIEQAARNVRAAAGTVEDAGNTARNAAPKADAFSGALGRIAERVVSAGVAFATYKIGQLVQDFGEQAFGTAAQLEQVNMGFQTLIGNTQDANSVFSQLVQYANVTPFQSKDILQASRTLMGFGTGAQQTVDIIKQLGDVVSAAGGDMNLLSLVTGQIFSQGKMRAQDMYQVINDGGAGLVKIMAENVGGMKNLTAMFEDGGVPAKMYFDAINQATDNGGFAFEGAVKQADTFNGRISTLKDTVTQFGMKLLGVRIDPKLGYVIDKGGLFDRSKEIIAQLNDHINKMDTKKIADQFTNAVKDAAQVLKEMWDIAVPVFKFLWDHRKTVAELAAMFVVLKAAIFISEAITAVQAGLAVLAGAYRGFAVIASTSVESVRRQMMLLQGAVSAPMVMGAIAVAGAIADVYLVKNAVDAVRGAIKAMNDEAAALNSDSQSIMSALDKLKNLQATGTPEQQKRAKEAYNKILKGLPTNAAGTNYWRGGATVVGETGPEVVELPTGSRIHSAKETKRMAVGGGTSVVIEQLNVNNNADVQSIVREIGWRLSIA